MTLKYKDDRDDNEYDLVWVDGTLWFAENLRYRVAGSSYMYKDDFVSFEKNGYLYSQEALAKICPPDCRLPTKDEYAKLYRYFQCSIDSKNYVQVLAGKLKEERISLQLGGLGSECMGDYFWEGDGAYFWTSSCDDEGNLQYCGMDFKGLSFDKPEQLQDLFSIRLIYDGAIAFKGVQGGNDHE